MASLEQKTNSDILLIIQINESRYKTINMFLTLLGRL